MGVAPTPPRSKQDGLVTVEEALQGGQPKRARVGEHEEVHLTSPFRFFKGYCKPSMTNAKYKRTLNLLHSTHSARSFTFACKRLRSSSPLSPKRMFHQIFCWLLYSQPKASCLVLGRNFINKYLLNE